MLYPVLSIVSVCNVYSVFWKFQNEQKWQYANKACCCSSKREKAKHSAADNCRMCGCCFKGQFGNLKSGCMDYKLWMFVAPTIKRWNITKVGWPSDKQTFRCPQRRRTFLHKSFLAWLIRNCAATLLPMREKRDTSTDNDFITVGNIVNNLLET